MWRASDEAELEVGPRSGPYLGKGFDLIGIEMNEDYIMTFLKWNIIK